VTQKFFNLGLPRSGTTSFSKALNQHGVLDLHFPRTYLTRLRQTGVMQVYTHPTLAWQGLSHAHEHACEYARLPDLYPGAKFVLTTRGVDSWIESFDALIAKMPPKSLAGTTLGWRFELIAGPDYRRVRDKERLRDFFLAHDEAVRAFFGADLLVLDLQEDDVVRAEKLAAWLGVDGMAYPHLHDRDGVPSTATARMKKTATELTLQLLAAQGYVPTTTTTADAR